MKVIHMYHCERCKYASTNRDECLAHEASHFGLTLSEYGRWRELTKAVEHAASICSSTSNPETRKNFDDAIREVVDFEQQHNLPDMRPSHF